MVLAVVAVLVIAGTVGWFVVARDSGEDRGAAGALTEAGEVDEATFTGTYLDVLERGNSLQCQWRLPEDAADGFQVGHGRLYTDGKNRGYTEAVFEIQGETTAGYAVIGPEYIYSWMDVPGMGFSGVRIPASQAEADFGDLPAAEQQQALDFRANYDFDCQPWTVNESLLAPPEDVSFTDINP